MAVGGAAPPPARPCHDGARTRGGVRDATPSPGPTLGPRGCKPSRRAGAIIWSRRRAPGEPGRRAPEGASGPARLRRSTGPPAIETEARRWLARGPFHLDGSSARIASAPAQSCSVSVRGYRRTLCTSTKRKANTNALSCQALPFELFVTLEHEVEAALPPRIGGAPASLGNPPLSASERSPGGVLRIRSSTQTNVARTGARAGPRWIRPGGPRRPSSRTASLRTAPGCALPSGLTPSLSR